MIRRSAGLFPTSSWLTSIAALLGAVLISACAKSPDTTTALTLALLPVVSPDFDTVVGGIHDLEPAAARRSVPLASVQEGRLWLFEPEAGRKRTGTSAESIEAVIRAGKVVAVGGSDSEIPQDGFVVAAEGSARAWMKKNLAKGVEVELEEGAIRVRPTIESGFAKLDHQTDQAEEILKAASRDPRVAPEQLASARSQLERAKSERTLAVAARAQRQDRQVRELLARSLTRTSMVDVLLQSSREEEGRAVYLRLNADSPKALERTISAIDGAGFNTIYLETVYDGRAIYPSPSILQPQHSQFLGWDPLAVALDAAHGRGLKVHAWVHVFQIGQPTRTPIVQEKPAWVALTRNGQFQSRLERGGVFLSPSSQEARQHILESLRYLVQLYGIDGLHLDDLRYGASDPWVLGYDYSAVAREDFHARTGYDPAVITPEENPEGWETWLQYREDQITEFIEIIDQEMERLKPELLLSARIHPDLDHARRSLGQNWALWAEAGLVDAVCPVIPTLQADELEARTAALRQILPPAVHLYTGIAVFLRPDGAELGRLVSAARQGGGEGTALISFTDLTDRLIQALQYGVFREEARLPRP